MFWTILYCNYTVYCTASCPRRVATNMYIKLAHGSGVITYIFAQSWSQGLRARIYFCTSCVCKLLQIKFYVHRGRTRVICLLKKNFITSIPFFTSRKVQQFVPITMIPIWLSRIGNKWTIGVHCIMYGHEIACNFYMSHLRSTHSTSTVSTLRTTLKI